MSRAFNIDDPQVTANAQAVGVLCAGCQAIFPDILDGGNPPGKRRTCVFCEPLPDGASDTNSAVQP